MLSSAESLLQLTMVYFNNTSAARAFGRILCLLLLLLLVPSCRSQASKYACFKPTDGYKYPESGTLQVHRSVLGLAVRRYMRGNKAVRAMYGQNMNDWCVGRVTAMDYMFYGLDEFNEPLHDWDVSSVTTMQGMVRISTNHECCLWLLHSPKTHAIGTFIVFLVA
jgi:surface protein